MTLASMRCSWAKDRFRALGLSSILREQGMGFPSHHTLCLNLRTSNQFALN